MRSLWVLVKISKSYQEQRNVRNETQLTNGFMKTTSIFLSFLAFHQHFCGNTWMTSRFTKTTSMHLSFFAFHQHSTAGLRRLVPITYLTLEQASKRVNKSPSRLHLDEREKETGGRKRKSQNWEKTNESKKGKKEYYNFGSVKFVVVPRQLGIVAPIAYWRNPY